MKHTYPYLPERRDFKYVPDTNPFMAESKRLALEESTDPNHPTGSVVVKEEKIIGRDSNKSALKNQTLMNFHRNVFCVRKFLKIKTGTKYWLCPGCATFKMHSEPRAVKDAQKKGFDTKGADLYLWGHWWCCKPCWDAMIEGGIKDTYLVDNADQLFKR